MTRDEIRNLIRVEVQNSVEMMAKASIEEHTRKTVYQLPAGELIDKFIVCHLRIWNLEEQITSGKGDKEVADASRRLRAVNAERARIREELNRRIDGFEVGSEKTYQDRLNRLVEVNPDPFCSEGQTGNRTIKDEGELDMRKSFKVVESSMENTFCECLEIKEGLSDRSYCKIHGEVK